MTVFIAADWVTIAGIHTELQFWHHYGYLKKTHTHTWRPFYFTSISTLTSGGHTGGGCVGGGLGHRGSVEMLSCFPLHCSCNGKGRQATNGCQMEKAVKVRMHVCAWGNENILCTTWTSSSTALILCDDKTKIGWRTDESQNDECERMCDDRNSRKSSANITNFLNAPSFVSLNADSDEKRELQKGWRAGRWVGGSQSNTSGLY